MLKFYLQLHFISNKTITELVNKNVFENKIRCYDLINQFGKHTSRK